MSTFLLHLVRVSLDDTNEEIIGAKLSNMGSDFMSLIKGNSYLLFKNDFSQELEHNIPYIELIVEFNYGIFIMSLIVGFKDPLDFKLYY